MTVCKRGKTFQTLCLQAFNFAPKINWLSASGSSLVLARYCYFKQNTSLLVKLLHPKFSRPKRLQHCLYFCKLRRKRLLSCRFDRTTRFWLPIVLRAQPYYESQDTEFLKKLVVVVHVLQTTQNWLFHAVVLQRTSKKCTKSCNARVKQLFCSLNFLFSDVPVPCTRRLSPQYMRKSKIRCPTETTRK